MAEHAVTARSSIVQPPTVTWPIPGVPPPPNLTTLACPNCGGTEAKAYALTIDLHAPDDTYKHLHVVRCPSCACYFYDNQSPPDYAAPAMVDRGRLPFYVQQGAGVSLITRPLAQVPHGPGSAYMEVGCGYGFSLDYAINTRHWHGRGIDPAALSALGRDALNLPIELRYLRDDDEARGTMDVVMGSEVIEHVTSPRAFVRTLRAMLRPGGTLILTTPNGDDIQPTTAPGVIVPLLSPSLHLTIQNPASLRWLLRDSGFAHIEVGVDGHSLVAFASDAPLSLEQDPTSLRATLREHLLRRAETLNSNTDIFLGFAGRALQEAVNDAEMDQADRAWAMLRPACLARFGLDIDQLTGLPPRLSTCSLEEMATLVPLNLGGVLYARAIRQLATGIGRPALMRTFQLAATAATTMRRALGELSMEDGQTEEIEWTAHAEAALCAAAADSPDAAKQIAALPSPPSGGPARLLAIQQRALGEWVNARHYRAARAFVRTTRLDQASFAQPASIRPLTDLERDTLFFLAVLDVQGDAPGEPAPARSRFVRVRAAADHGGGLWWASLGGELQALDLMDAQEDAAQLVRQIVREHPDIALPPGIAARIASADPD